MSSLDDLEHIRAGEPIEAFVSGRMDRKNGILR